MTKVWLVEADVRRMSLRGTYVIAIAATLESAIAAVQRDAANWGVIEFVTMKLLEEAQVHKNEPIIPAYRGEYGGIHYSIVERSVLE